MENRRAFLSPLEQKHEDLLQKLEKELDDEEFNRLMSFENSRMTGLSTNSQTLVDFLGVKREMAGDRMISLQLGPDFDEVSALKEISNQMGAESDQPSYADIDNIVSSSEKPVSAVIHVDKATNFRGDPTQEQKVRKIQDQIRYWHSSGKLKYLYVSAPTTTQIPTEIARNASYWFEVKSLRG